MSAVADIGKVSRLGAPDVSNGWGSISQDQVAFGSAASKITGSANFTWTGAILKVSPSGTRKFQVDATGVGVGDVSPGYSLHVQAAGPTLMVRSPTSAQSKIVADVATNGFSRFDLWENGTERAGLLWQGISDQLYLWAVGSSTPSITLNTTGDVVMGTAALATTATAGFLWLNTQAGHPTGTPAATFTGRAPVSVDTSNKRINAYTGSAWDSVPLRLGGQNSTIVGNVGAGEDDLHSYTIPANTLRRDGEAIEAEFWLRSQDTDGTTIFDVYWNGVQVIEAGVTNEGVQVIKVRIVRYSTGVQTVVATSFGDDTNGPYVAIDDSGGADETAAVVLKVTGTSAGSTTDDAQCVYSQWKWCPPA